MNWNIFIFLLSEKTRLKLKRILQPPFVKSEEVDALTASREVAFFLQLLFALVMDCVTVCLKTISKKKVFYRTEQGIGSYAFLFITCLLTSHADLVFFFFINCQ